MLIRVLLKFDEMNTDFSCELKTLLHGINFLVNAEVYLLSQKINCTERRCRPLSPAEITTTPMRDYVSEAK